jgi:hypothetical protein
MKVGLSPFLRGKQISLTALSAASEIWFNDLPVEEELKNQRLPE